MPSRVKITPEREEALRRVLAALSDAGVPKATVALALRLHPRTVQQLRVMFGISASTPAPVTWTPEEDAVIQTAMGIGEAMKGLPHRTRAGITERKACLGVRWPRAQGKRRTNIQKARNRPDREVAITLPGEVWKDVPAYGVRVSTLARAASLHT